MSLETEHLSPEELALFIEDLLGPEDRGTVGGHLVRCQDCLYFLDSVLLGAVPSTPEETALLEHWVH